MGKFRYSFRPAKHIERRMLVDSWQRLRAFAALTDYEYIGFGGFEFLDFELVHRTLGTERLVSIELDGKFAARYEANAPFADIDIHFDRASAVLPDLLDGDRLRIVWLDYEQRLNHEVLQDVGTCLRRMRPGSVLVVTVNAYPPKPSNIRLEVLTKDVGEERVPDFVKGDADLARWGLAQASYEVLAAEALSRSRRREISFEQLFHIRYADDAYMLTWGGVLVDDATRGAFEAANFDELEQVRTGDEALMIDVPSLTARETLSLNEQLPANKDDLDGPGLLAKDLDAYAQLYRWYPPTPAPL